MERAEAACVHLAARVVCERQLNRMFDLMQNKQAPCFPSRPSISITCSGPTEIASSSSSATDKVAEGTTGRCFGSCSRNGSLPSSRDRIVQRL